MDRNHLIAEIDAFQTKVALSDTAIGIHALNDGKFVGLLRGGRRVWPETARKVQDFMAAAYTMITTADGTVIVRDLKSGATASGRNLSQAYSELRRLIDRDQRKAG